MEKYNRDAHPCCLPQGFPKFMLGGSLEPPSREDREENSKNFAHFGLVVVAYGKIGISMITLREPSVCRGLC